MVVKRGGHGKVDLIRNINYPYQMASQGDPIGSESQGMKDARPAILKAEWRGAWHGSSEQSAVIHWEHSWASGIWERTQQCRHCGFLGAQRFTAPSSRCRTGPCQAVFAKRAEPAQALDFSSLQIANEVARMAFGTLLAERAPPIPVPSVRP